MLFTLYKTNYLDERLIHTIKVYKLFMQLAIYSPAHSNSSSEIFKGGTRRIQWSANKNQSINNGLLGCCIAERITFKTMSESSISTANINPICLISLGLSKCFKILFFNKSPFSSTLSINLSFKITSKAAFPAAQHKGCPPNVVI